MTPEEARALLRSLPVYRFDALVLTGFAFPKEHTAQFASFDADGRALLEFNTEADITPLRVVHEYGHALRAKYLNPIPAFWKTLAESALWALPTWGDPYDEGFAQCVSWLWTPDSPVPLASVFRSDAAVAQVKAYIESLLPEKEIPKVRVLWHLSHHSSIRPDGWSGAPDEARWVREDLTPLVIAECSSFGIEIVTVDGDLLDHPEFHANYMAFCAPHYEANVHGEGGSFWGRAANSSTSAQDDRLGGIFWKHYRMLTGKPPDRFGWSNPNVTDYYGFRLTSVSTPGILVEHGVGAPLAPDHDWLRKNTPAIARVWADTLVEFRGPEEVDMAFKDDPDAIAYREDVRQTFEAIKTELAKLAHHRHEGSIIAAPFSTSEPKA